MRTKSVEVRLIQFPNKVLRNISGNCIRFPSSHNKTIFLLFVIHSEVWISERWNDNPFLAKFGKYRNSLGYEILMFNIDSWNMSFKYLSNFSRPQTTTIHNSTNLEHLVLPAGVSSS